jgi:hypothetical protein
LRSRRNRDLNRLAALAIEGTEVDQQRVGALDEFPNLFRLDRHLRHGTGRQQHVGGEILRDPVGDAVNARRSRAQTRQNVCRNARQADRP